MERFKSDISFVQRSIQFLDIKKCKQLAHWLEEHIHNLEIDKEHFKVSITEINLSTRALNILRYNNILTVGQLLKKAANWDNIHVLRGAGPKVQQEIYHKVIELRKQQ